MEKPQMIMTCIPRGWLSIIKNLTVETLVESEHYPTTERLRGLCAVIDEAIEEIDDLSDIEAEIQTEVKT